MEVWEIYSVSHAKYVTRSRSPFVQVRSTFLGHFCCALHHPSSFAGVASLLAFKSLATRFQVSSALIGNSHPRNRLLAHSMRAACRATMHLSHSESCINQIYPPTYPQLQASKEVQAGGIIPGMQRHKFTYVLQLVRFAALIDCACSQSFR